MPGTITLIGAGELAPAGSKLHRPALAGLEPTARPVFLDTPAGFETNVEAITAKAVEYYHRHFHLELGVAHYGHRAEAGEPEAAAAIAAIRAANLILAGPGSPTFAIDQWAGSPVWDAVVRRFEGGARLLFASAAAITLGRYALPVYEIYKAGRDPHWADGLDLFSRFGLSLAIIPHYNDSSGGEHYDSRFCYMGAKRFDALCAQLPDEVAALGIDAYTAVTFDPATERATVIGKGLITVTACGEALTFGEGSVIPFAALRASPAAPKAASRAGSADSGDPEPAAEGSDLEAIASYVQGLDSLRTGDRIELLARLEGLRRALEAPAPKGEDGLIELALRLRRALREAGRYDMADMARDALVQMGLIVSDAPEGTTWTRP